MGPPQLPTNEIFRLQYLASVWWLGSLVICWSNLAETYDCTNRAILNRFPLFHNIWCIVFCIHTSYIIISCWKVEKGELLPGTRTKNLWCPAGIKLGILGHGLGVSGGKNNREPSPPEHLVSTFQTKETYYANGRSKVLQQFIDVFLNLSAGTMQDLTVGLVGGTLSWAWCHSVRMCVDGTQIVYTLVRLWLPHFVLAMYGFIVFGPFINRATIKCWDLKEHTMSVIWVSMFLLLQAFLRHLQLW